MPGCDGLGLGAICLVETYCADPGLVGGSGAVGYNFEHYFVETLENFQESFRYISEEDSVKGLLE
ncbi:hypothetical protein OUZ56_016376 [Daphnia magna]|uniref:Uncharacterized protein n=1 Tax=Daphnia magna TaxID=35525 RepID=A0ABR0AQJ5_9CRUS|nr:hypothetical protein OUZ56_016376 [Daphnia magna]